MVNVNKKQFDSNSRKGKCQNCNLLKDICYFSKRPEPDIHRNTRLILIETPIKELCWDCVNELGRIN